MREVDLKLVSGFTMGHGVGNSLAMRACVVAQAKILDDIAKGQPIIIDDHLECACPVLRSLAICLNDMPWWKDDEERTKTLRPLIPFLLDSRGAPAVTVERARLAASMAATAAQFAGPEADGTSSKQAHESHYYAEMAASCLNQGWGVVEAYAMSAAARAFDTIANAVSDAPLAFLASLLTWRVSDAVIDLRNKLLDTWHDCAMLGLVDQHAEVPDVVAEEQPELTRA